MKRPMIWVAALGFILGACNQKKDYDAIFNDPNLYCQTVHELNGVVMGNNFAPIVASRNYAYAAIAGYEAIAAGYPEKFRSLGGQLRGLGALPKPGAGQNIQFGLAGLLAYCKLGEAVTFPAGSMKEYTDSLKQMARDHGMPSDMLEQTIAFSDTIGSVILAWAGKDRYKETRGASEFTVLDSPGRWVPTPPAYSPATEPHWREIRPMVMDSATQFVPPPPLPYNIKDKNSPYYKEVMLIKNAVDSLTPEQAHIADFWDDNPFKLNVSGHLMFGTKKFSPGGHWMSIVGIAAMKSKADLPTTAMAFAETSIALFDAFIQCWDEKFRHNTIRPETVINKYFDPNWRPRLQTPSFPEYTCGHSTISAAAAEALTHIFGDHFSYTDSTEMEFGIKNRSFESFRAAAIENNWARFYGGLHFHQSCIVSTEYGQKVGALVVDRLKMKQE